MSEEANILHGNQASSEEAKILHGKKASNEEEDILHGNQASRFVEYKDVRNLFWYDPV